MADTNKNPAETWSLHVGTIVMTGIAAITGVDGGIATAIGSDVVARVSLGTASSCALAAVGSLAYAQWRRRGTSA
jgi:hypothetical protein